MGKKNLDWANLPFGYIKTDRRFVANYKDGAWDSGKLIKDDKVKISECACVLQYAQTCFEGLKAYKGEVLLVDINYNADSDSVNYKKHECIIEKIRIQ